MTAPLDSWEAARDFALGLPGTELSTSYGKPAVKVAANGRAFLGTGRESDTAFVLHIDVATAEMLMATGPETFWQTPHYEGYGAVLVRYASPDPQRVRDMIRQAHEQAAAMPPVARRKR
ncbi:MmcQ/YjbR family DNA-binding protein [Erythrobacter sp. BLCC-B19]|uniref:MmcQ/YjbR family DNA-binding protein n=1 Tax=Erythrobacter sp. BLCC-B19 TaxID=3025315 RepID=UPI00235F4C41|nr:MmcQ/YjbR family DNA-binding protein [Erythrobacter sp. BLCC-B19]WDA39991.1 MmcQ/YjbR family DNA-binding protein [Erythrobacter sp. BLCC-B19]